MTWRWYQLTFPLGLEAKSVLHFTRTLAVRPRRGWLRRADPVVIEVLSQSGRISWHLGVTARDHSQVVAALHQALPSVQIAAADRRAFAPAGAWELRLSSQRRSLQTQAPEQVAGAILSALARSRPDETVLLQWLIGPWLPRRVVPPVTRRNQHQDLLFDLDQLALNSEQRKALRDKHSEPLFGVMGRLAVSGATPARQAILRQGVVGALQLLRAPGVGVERRLLPSALVRRRLERLQRPAVAWPCNLNAAELTACLGWPIGNPVVPGVHYGGHRELPPGAGTLVRTPGVQHRITGRATYPGIAGWLSLPMAEALHHLHVLGPTGTGKSTLLANLALQDIEAGRSVVVIDPSSKGDLIRDIADRIPSHRLDDVVLLDPSDPQPLGLNVLAGEPTEVVVDAVLHVIQELYAAYWGPRTADILGHALSTLAMQHLTLCELSPLLTNPAFRRRHLAGVQNDHLGVGPFWVWYEALSDNERNVVIGPVMNKLRAFTGRPSIRNIIGQTNGFRLEELFTKRRVLLVTLAAGQIGSEAAQLLGALLVSQLWMAIQRRGAIPAERRHPAIIYLDEFQNVLRLQVDLSDALVAARGLGVGLVLSHQHLAQLNPAVRAAALANAASRIVFRLGHDDAAVVAKQLGTGLTPADFQQLGRFETYQAISSGSGRTTPASARTLPLVPSKGTLDVVRTRSRQRYGRPRAEVDAELLRRREVPPDLPEAGIGTRQRKARP